MRKFVEVSLLEEMLSDAINLINGIDFEKFAISTRIPNKWLVEEETNFDESLLKIESIKNYANRKLVGGLLKLTNKKYDSNNADIRLIFDFEKNSVSIDYEPLFIFGRYKKLVPEVSQSRWLCKKCDGDGCFKCDYKGKNYDSVEEFIGDPIKEAADAKDYSLHASGREDVDAVNTAGRPFVFEIKSPKKHKFNLDEVKNKINSGGKVEVSDLKFVNRETVEVVTESHFDKEYEAKVETQNEFDGDSLEKIVAGLKGTVIEQRTPNRVAHRRSDLIRRRKIIDLKVSEIDSKNKKFKILVLAEAGTYIKELISGDKGRTKPSISDLIGPAKCKSLSVTRIHDDFLKMLFNYNLGT
ncbi:tRNA pseudouridine(54/55) synthase Pus10 [Candidatus Micrarchaeota archaeon]|nr:tRNA pseudouridine(54/55) synthase Pus10 [Candidatus Micrarchaeota archaeon]